MAEPKIACRTPAVVTVEPGTYYWCSCGESAKQPYCDGSHKGSEFSPVRVDIEEQQTIAFCQCKRTGNAPKCDGAHKHLPA